MNKYLLLRSNKQTGPYSLEELREMGLKAYDLVWVEGKSAAWRYPGEVDDLKSFAPPVEEQPYDRFFKRPTQINQPLFTPSRAQNNVAEEQPVAVRRSEPETISISPKPVYVSSPAERQIAQEKEIVKSIPQKPSITAEQNGLASEQVKYAPKTRETAETRPSRSYAPIMDIERIDSEPELPINRQTATRSSRVYSPSPIGAFLKPFAIGFGLAAFLGIGVFIGLSINNRGTVSPKDKDISVKEDAANGGQTALYHPSTIPLVTPPVTDDKSFDNAVPGQQDAQAAARDEKAAEERRKAKARQKISDSLRAMKPKPVADSSTIQAATHITRIAESTLVKESVKNNIADYVGISGNKYSVGTFGGISDLQLTVSNKSTYGLDLVVVEVQYIQSNKKVFKTENLYFRNIGAGSALMQEAPKSSRGVKVQYKITVINSKELGVAYSGI